MDATSFTLTVKIKELEEELKRLITLHDETGELEARQILEKHFLEVARQIGELCFLKKQPVLGKSERHRIS